MSNETEAVAEGKSANAMPHVDMRDYESGSCRDDASYEVQSRAMYGDAVMLTPYDELEYGQEFTFSFGAHAESKKWKTATMSLGEFIAKLCRHVEGEKDGPAFVLAKMVAGQRLKTSVIMLTAIGIDIDTGMSTEEVDAAIKKLGFLAVRYTTHSNLKTKSEFKRDKIVKFILDNDPLRKLEDDETIRWFLAENEDWEPSIIETAT
jgi:hypothetical protein